MQVELGMIEGVDVMNVRLLKRFQEENMKGTKSESE